MFDGGGDAGGRVVEKRHSPPAGVLAVHGGKNLKGELAACPDDLFLFFNTVASDMSCSLCLKNISKWNIFSTDAQRSIVIFRWGFCRYPLVGGYSRVRPKHGMGFLE